MTKIQTIKQQERQARRAHIQNVAREVFAEKGYTKTSIEEVARRAGLSVGAIYLYFRSKDELYVSLLEKTLERFDHDLAQLVQGEGDLRDAWHYFIAWAESDVEGPRILRLLAYDGSRQQLSDEVAECVTAGLARVRGHLATLVRRCVETGVYRPPASAEELNRTVDIFSSLYLGVLQVDAMRRNLGIQGDDFARAATATFTTVESGLRVHPTRVAEAA